MAERREVKQVEWTHVLTIPAILALGVVYGTDMFFAVVARSALAHVSESSLTEVMGRLHEYADRRMPLFGVLGIVSTLILLVVAPSAYAALAFGAQVIHLGLYFGVARPVNATLTAAAIRGESLPDARQLQNRWDSVILPRALLLSTAMACIAFIAIQK